MRYRSGIGYDVHAFAEGRLLTLGGIVIPHDRGLSGHSDADVRCHAIADAILGAIGEPDMDHGCVPFQRGLTVSVKLRARISVHDCC